MSGDDHDEAQRMCAVIGAEHQRRMAARPGISAAKVADEMQAEYARTRAELDDPAAIADDHAPPAWGGPVIH